MFAWIVLAVITLLLFVIYQRNQAVLKCFLFTGVTGVASMFAVGFMSTGLLSWNLFTVLTAIFTGIPGVAATVLLNHFLI